jgi:iron complex transport system substrate-binding protein
MPRRATSCRLDAIAAESTGQPRPRVFFEEWHDPLISGTPGEELVEIAGGEPIFEFRGEHDARNRIVTPQAVAERDPEVVIASWCGRKVNKEWIRARLGWGFVAAIRDGQVHEVKSTIILQPGPAALTDGVRRLREIIAGASNRLTKPI